MKRLGPVDSVCKITPSFFLNRLSLDASPEEKAKLTRIVTALRQNFPIQLSALNGDLLIDPADLNLDCPTSYTEHNLCFKNKIILPGKSPNQRDFMVILGAQKRHEKVIVHAAADGHSVILPGPSIAQVEERKVDRAFADSVIDDFCETLLVQPGVSR